MKNLFKQWYFYVVTALSICVIILLVAFILNQNKSVETSNSVSNTDDFTYISSYLKGYEDRIKVFLNKGKKEFTILLYPNGENDNCNSQAGYISGKLANIGYEKSNLITFMENEYKSLSYVSHDLTDLESLERNNMDIYFHDDYVDALIRSMP